MIARFQRDHEAELIDGLALSGGAGAGITPPMAAITRTRVVTDLERVALCSVMLLPLLLLHAHGIAEVAIGVADVCFLTRCALARDWGWLRMRWLWFSGAWWGWLVVCSLPLPALGLGEGGVRSLLQALATARFLLL